jgi:hypothetical protein
VLILSLENQVNNNEQKSKVQQLMLGMEIGKEGKKKGSPFLIRDE